MRLTKTNLNGMVWFASQGADLWLEPCEMSYRDNGIAIKKLAAYEDAEEQGRLMILPCKVGTPVYFIKKTGFHPKLIETKIDEIGVRHGGMFFKLSCNSMYRTAISAWGKTVFLTREEAEAVLKGENKDDELERKDA